MTVWEGCQNKVALSTTRALDDLARYGLDMLGSSVLLRRKQIAEDRKKITRRPQVQILLPQPKYRTISMP